MTSIVREALAAVMTSIVRGTPDAAMTSIVRAAPGRCDETGPTPF